MGELQPRKPPDRLPANPMRRTPLKALVCSLLAVTLLIATSQYLAHFHVPQVAQADVEPILDHGADEHCTLCLQFDRLPASPAPAQSPAAYFFHVATVEAERLERLALADPQLWPPSRGPPSLAC
jgi:hypothetical protein